jgi:urea transporter
MLSFLAVVVAILLLEKCGERYIPAAIRHSAAFVLFVAAVPIWFKAVATWIRIRRWPCPRCGKPFVVASWSTVLTNECKHCDLAVSWPEALRNNSRLD